MTHLNSLELFAACAPGLEPALEQELRALQLWQAARPTTGGVDFTGNWVALQQANHSLRTASRVLVRVGQVRATEFWEFRKRARLLPWGQFVRPGQPVALRVTCHKSKLYHSDAVAERLAGAISDALGQPSTWVKSAAEDAETEQPQLIIARFDHDVCTLSVDSSGPLLHLRGYRLATAKAPLRETLAAGMLLLAGWNAQAPLLDPFCGAGTIALEAAQMAAGVRPGHARHFAYEQWPAFKARPLTWPAPAAAPEKPWIYASDRDAGAMEAAHANAERARIAAWLTLQTQPLSAITPLPGPGWVITNPPYGVRLGAKQDLRNLYAQLGNVLRARCPGWHLAFLCPDQVLAHHTGFTFDPARCPTLFNGGQRVTLWQTTIGA